MYVVARPLRKFPRRQGTIDATYYLDDQARTVDDGTVFMGYAYDGAGAMLLRSLTRANNAALDTTYQYNDAGVLNSMSGGPVAGTITWSNIDLLGRPVTVT